MTKRFLQKKLAVGFEENFREVDIKSKKATLNSRDRGNEEHGGLACFSSLSV